MGAFDRNITLLLNLRIPYSHFTFLYHQPTHQLLKKKIKPQGELTPPIILYKKMQNTRKHFVVPFFVSQFGFESHHLFFIPSRVTVATKRPMREPKSFAHATLVTPQVSELQAWLISVCTLSLLCD